jgi:hypothetical protein
MDRYLIKLGLYIVKHKLILTNTLAYYGICTLQMHNVWQMDRYLIKLGLYIVKHKLILTNTLAYYGICTLLIHNMANGNIF